MIVRARPWLLLGWITLTIALTGLQLRPAHAATGDQIDTLTVSYTLNDDGSLRVDERIVLRFGPNPDGTASNAGSSPASRTTTTKT